MIVTLVTGVLAVKVISNLIGLFTLWSESESIGAAAVPVMPVVAVAVDPVNTDPPEPAGPVGPVGPAAPPRTAVQAPVNPALGDQVIVIVVVVLTTLAHAWVSAPVLVITQEGSAVDPLPSVVPYGMLVLVSPDDTATGVTSGEPLPPEPEPPVACQTAPDQRHWVGVALVTPAQSVSVIIQIWPVIGLPGRLA